MTILDSANNKLCINISHTAPEELRVNLINSMSAAIRWYAGTEYKDKLDGGHLFELSNLLTNLNNLNE